ncbi:MAG: hypothetical protein U0840_03750 [Gemmataceae bacterium]
MTQMTRNPVSLISTLVVLALLVVTLVASGCIWWTGDWENHAGGLALALRIIWGLWLLAAVAGILTNVTVFGWSFRRYIRWTGDNLPAWARFRPTRAPWSKSGATSFSFTVAMVSITGVIAITTIIMWILMDVTGEDVFWLVFRILGISWWVLIIALVLARVAVFGIQRRNEILEQNKPEPTLAGHPTSESRS